MNIILKAAAALLAVTLAASCVFEKEEPSQTQQKYKYVLVQLGVNTDKMTATKADGDVTESDPETAINDLRVYAYTKGDNGNKVLCGYLYAEDVDTASENTAPLLMDIKVPFNEYKNEQTVYFAAIANSSAMKVPQGVIIDALGRNPDGSLVPPANFAWSSFGNITYKIDQEEFPDTGMPMYFQTDETKDAVTEYDPNDSADDDAPVKINLMATGTPVNQPGHNGHTKLPIKVTLGMTRSLAKITVHAAESAAETTGKNATTSTSVTITGVSLANVPESGNLFTAPSADAPITYTTFIDAEGKETAYSGSFLNGGTVNKKVDGASKNDTEEPDNYTLVSDAYYLAENNQGEYDFGTVDYTTVENPTKATVLKIDYSLDGGTTSKSGYVKMPQIKRNTWYKVLARIKANGKAEIKVVAVAWNYNSEVISFEEIVSMTGSPVWKDNNGVVVSGSTTSYTFGANRNQTATCEFTLQTPKGGTWYATIEGNDIQDFTFVDKNDQDEEEVVLGKTVSGAIGVEDDMTFTIKTLTDIGFGQSKTVKVRLIAVSKDGISQNVQISGEDYFTITQQN